PTGSVNFFDGTNAIGSGTLATVAGQQVATLTYAALSVSPPDHNITASYIGDTNFTGNTSAILPQTVNKANSSVGVATSPAAPVFGQSVSFTATVTAKAPGSGTPAAIVYSQSVTFATVVTANAPGAGTPTGVVTFFANNVTLGTGNLDGTGHASFTTSAVPGGVQSITATYGGDPSFAGSTTANAFTENVTPANATVTPVQATKTSTAYGESVVFTTTVTAAAPATGTPVGVVNFLDNGNVFGTGTVSGGTASFTETTQLAAGNHSITVAYVGDG